MHYSTGVWTAAKEAMKAAMESESLHSLADGLFGLVVDATEGLHIQADSMEPPDRDALVFMEMGLALFNKVLCTQQFRNSELMTLRQQAKDIVDCTLLSNSIQERLEVLKEDTAALRAFNAELKADLRPVVEAAKRAGYSDEIPEAWGVILGPITPLAQNTIVTNNPRCALGGR